MRKEKNGKRDLNAANDSDRVELRCFARRNRVSMDEARAIAGQFGRDRLIASANAKPKARQPSKARTPQTVTAKGNLLADAAMYDPEEEI